MLQRVICLIIALILVCFSWVFLFYVPQSQKLNGTQHDIRIQEQAIRQEQQKNQTILHLSKDKATDKLLNKFHQLSKSLHALEQKISQYHHQYISDKELGKLLYSMLNQVSGVSIERFSTLTPEGDEKEDSSDVTYALSRGAVDAVSLEASPKVAGSGSEDVPREEDMDSIRYTLILKGNFYAIVEYLQRIEHLKWELYWDKLTYEVQTYPLGLVTVEFYTLKPKDPEEVTTPGSADSGTPS